MDLKIFDRITNRQVQFFGKFDINLRFDSIGSDYSFEIFFDPNNPEHKRLCAPARYNLAKVEHNGERLLTGFILGQSFNKAPTSTLNKFQGYSVPGVLEESDIPISSYPLQSDGLTLRQIANKLVTPFQIKMDIDDDIADQMDIVYEKTTAEASQKVGDYLQELCSQRNIILSHTAKGHLLFTRTRADLKPVYHFEEGQPATQITLSFNGNGMHNQITVIKQADKDGGNAGQSTVLNPYVPIDTTAFRPKVVIQTSGTDNDTQKAAMHELASELKNIVVTVSTDRWVLNGSVIKPNQVISITAPDCFIYKKTNFFIEAVNLSGDPQQTIATLTCVPVEVYNGQMPINIFAQ